MQTIAFCGQCIQSLSPRESLSPHKFPRDRRPFRADIIGQCLEPSTSSHSGVAHLSGFVRKWRLPQQWLFQITDVPCSVPTLLRSHWHPPSSLQLSGLSNRGQWFCTEASWPPREELSIAPVLVCALPLPAKSAPLQADMMSSCAKYHRIIILHVKKLKSLLGKVTFQNHRSVYGSNCDSKAYTSTTVLKIDTFLKWGF